MALLGAHVSAAGGVSNAFANAAAIGCDALQIFVKNANRWAAKPLPEPERSKYKAAQAEHGDPPVIAHASYLINLSATNPETLVKSRAALKDELGRCHELGVKGLVVHPGAHLGEGVEAGLAAVAHSLELILAELEQESANTVPVLLENTAGQGTTLGSSLEELGQIITQCKLSARLGVCLDTCHAFAAGYSVQTETGLTEFLDEATAQFSLERIGCFHLNDSQYPLGSRRDRHANLGEGYIGLDTFVRLAADSRFTDVPMLLETPTGDDGEGHGRDLAKLRAALA